MKDTEKLTYKITEYILSLGFRISDAEAKKIIRMVHKFDKPYPLTAKDFKNLDKLKKAVGA